MEELLAILKRSMGIGEQKTAEDEMYIENLKAAQDMLRAEDISKTVLESKVGNRTVVLIAKSLIRDQDIATNQTITLLRNQLSAMTKGERTGNANR